MKSVQGALASVLAVLILVIWLAAVVRPLLPWLLGGLVLAVVGRALVRRP